MNSRLHRSLFRVTKAFKNINTLYSFCDLYNWKLLLGISNFRIRRGLKAHVLGLGKI